MDESVKKLYSKWRYPEPVLDLEVAVNNGWYDFGDPKLFWHLYWPYKKYEPISILIAGCGTHQAAYYAYANPTCQVTGVDSSEAAIEHENFLKEKHNLKNLTLINCDLESIDSVSDSQYDLIICSGVLHHIEKTELVLQKLKNLLASAGKMNLMLYGRYPRTGIYMMQEVFKILNLGIEEKDISTAKDILSKLPPWHYVTDYLKKSSDCGTDAGIADTFLNPIDKSYTVKDVFELIDSSGLEFVDWNDRLYYSLDIIIDQDESFKNLSKDLTDREKFKLVELITLQLATHRFIVSLPNQSDRVVLNKDNWNAVYPVLRHGLFIEDMILTRGFHKLQLNRDQFSIISNILKNKSVKDICLDTGLDSNLVFDFINRLQSYGHIFLTK